MINDSSEEAPKFVLSLEKSIDDLPEKYQNQSEDSVMEEMLDAIQSNCIEKSDALQTIRLYFYLFLVCCFYERNGNFQLQRKLVCILL